MFQRLVLIAALIFAFLAPVAAEPPLTVFAAASMREAMEQIGAEFEKETGTGVVFSFAGTGTLARQVEAGAPADIFVSADTDWMNYVLDSGSVISGTVRGIASNSLVLVGPQDSPDLKLQAGDLEAALGDGRLAIADPDTVPAGRYGKAALETLGLWQSVSGSQAPMENVRIVLATVAHGDTPLGLVYGTDAAAEPDVRVVARLPGNSHPEIRYMAALTNSGTRPSAGALLEYLSSARAKEILHSLGFVNDNGS